VGEECSALESMVTENSFRPSPVFWQGRRVLVTGHTGFKGAWLSLWLSQLGAEVSGISLPGPVSSPNLFDLAGLSEVLTDVRSDIRDSEALSQYVGDMEPSLVFHLAAQPLVRRGYREPEETFSSNIQGTANILEAVLGLESIAGAIVVTSDKCYLNNNQGRRFVEADPLGGHDPYSASKAAAEMVAAGYRALDNMPPVYSVRAGNVIGGGDWGEDRLIPDMVRAFSDKEEVVVRNPASSRPWQHVLDCLSGYIAVAETHLDEAVEREASAGEAYNFGPLTDNDVPVCDIADRFVDSWGEGAWRDASADQSSSVSEALTLGLDPLKAVEKLNWRPRWQVEQAVDRTANWYRDLLSGESASVLCERDIDAWGD
jgi:CDP-glucose 4,6-dehydratase